ncbi:MAG: GNAT family acetyltransferase [Acidobacteriota bacterium]
MFADLAVAARIESAEAALTAGIVRSIPDPGARVLELAGGVAAFARAHSPMNKAIGFGFAGPVGAADVDAILELARAGGEPARAEISTLVDPSILAAFSARGFALQAFEHVLGLRIASDLAAREPAAGIVVARTGGPQDEAAWREVAVEGFAAPDGTGAAEDELPRDALGQVMDDFGGAPGLEHYLARVDGVPAGAASCRFDRGIAQLCGATTLAAFRRRGVQRALLAARLADAARHGCDLAVVTTAPGSQSQANVQRHGFALLYARAVLGAA